MDYYRFLKELLPAWGLRPTPFLRRNIGRKVSQRLKILGIRSYNDYLKRVLADPQEQEILYQIFTVTISRFFRDYSLFRNLFEKYLAPMVRGGVWQYAPTFNVWCAGCAAGEEAYTLAILWRECFGPERIPLKIIATDLREDELERARRAQYKASGLKEVSPDVLSRYFTLEEKGFRLREEVKQAIIFQRHDLLKEPPLEGMNLILCRNLAFTYFSPEAQEKVGKKLWQALVPGGILFLGKKEKLPSKAKSLFSVVDEEGRVYGK